MFFQGIDIVINFFSLIIKKGSYLYISNYIC